MSNTAQKNKRNKSLNKNYQNSRKNSANLINQSPKISKISNCSPFRQFQKLEKIRFFKPKLNKKIKRKSITSQSKSRKSNSNLLEFTIKDSSLTNKTLDGFMSKTQNQGNIIKISNQLKEFRTYQSSDLININDLMNSKNSPLLQKTYGNSALNQLKMCLKNKNESNSDFDSQSLVSIFGNNHNICKKKENPK